MKLFYCYLQRSFAFFVTNGFGVLLFGIASKSKAKRARAYLKKGILFVTNYCKRRCEMFSILRLRDEEWACFARYIPKAKTREDGRGRPRRSAREVLEGIIWMLNSGTPWHMLPKDYPPYQTCHRYFQRWRQQDVFRGFLSRRANEKQREKESKQPLFVDATFARAKKGAQV